MGSSTANATFVALQSVNIGSENLYVVSHDAQVNSATADVNIESAATVGLLASHVDMSSDIGTLRIASVDGTLLQSSGSLIARSANNASLRAVADANLYAAGAIELEGVSGSVSVAGPSVVLNSAATLTSNSAASIALQAAETAALYSDGSFVFASGGDMRLTSLNMQLTAIEGVSIVSDTAEMVSHFGPANVECGSILTVSGQAGVQVSSMGDLRVEASANNVLLYSGGNAVLDAVHDANFSAGAVTVTARSVVAATAQSMAVISGADNLISSTGHLRYMADAGDASVVATAGVAIGTTGSITVSAGNAVELTAPEVSMYAETLSIHGHKSPSLNSDSWDEQTHVGEDAGVIATARGYVTVESGSKIKMASFEYGAYIDLEANDPDGTVMINAPRMELGSDEGSIGVFSMGSSIFDAESVLEIESSGDSMVHTADGTVYVHGLGPVAMTAQQGVTAETSVFAVSGYDLQTNARQLFSESYSTAITSQNGKVEIHAPGTQGDIRIFGSASTSSAEGSSSWDTPEPRQAQSIGIAIHSTHDGGNVHISSEDGLLLDGNITRVDAVDTIQITTEQNHTVAAFDSILLTGNDVRILGHTVTLESNTSTVNVRSSLRTSAEATGSVSLEASGMGIDVSAASNVAVQAAGVLDLDAGRGIVISSSNGGVRMATAMQPILLSGATGIAFASLDDDVALSAGQAIRARSTSGEVTISGASANIVDKASDITLVSADGFNMAAAKSMEIASAGHIAVAAVGQVSARAAGLSSLRGRQIYLQSDSADVGISSRHGLNMFAVDYTASGNRVLSLDARETVSMDSRNSSALRANHTANITGSKLNFYTPQTLSLSASRVSASSSDGTNLTSQNVFISSADQISFDSSSNIEAFAANQVDILSNLEAVTVSSREQVSVFGSVGVNLVAASLDAKLTASDSVSLHAAYSPLHIQGSETLGIAAQEVVLRAQADVSLASQGPLQSRARMYMISTSGVTSMGSASGSVDIVAQTHIDSSVVTLHANTHTEIHSDAKLQMQSAGSASISAGSIALHADNSIMASSDIAMNANTINMDGTMDISATSVNGSVVIQSTDATRLSASSGSIHAESQGSSISSTALSILAHSGQDSAVIAGASINADAKHINFAGADVTVTSFGGSIELVGEASADVAGADGVTIASDVNVGSTGHYIYAAASDVAGVEAQAVAISADTIHVESADGTRLHSDDTARLSGESTLSFVSTDTAGLFALSSVVAADRVVHFASGAALSASSASYEMTSHSGRVSMSGQGVRITAPENDIHLHAARNAVADAGIGAVLEANDVKLSAGQLTIQADHKRNGDELCASARASDACIHLLEGGWICSELLLAGIDCDLAAYCHYCDQALDSGNVVLAAAQDVEILSQNDMHISASRSVNLASTAASVALSGLQDIKINSTDVMVNGSNAVIVDVDGSIRATTTTRQFVMSSIGNITASAADSLALRGFVNAEYETPDSGSWDSLDDQEDISSVQAVTLSAVGGSLRVASDAAQNIHAKTVMVNALNFTGQAAARLRIAAAESLAAQASSTVQLAAQAENARIGAVTGHVSVSGAKRLALSAASGDAELYSKSQLSLRALSGEIAGAGNTVGINATNGVDLFAPDMLLSSSDGMVVLSGAEQAKLSAAQNVSLRAHVDTTVDSASMLLKSSADASLRAHTTLISSAGKVSLEGGAAAIKSEAQVKVEAARLLDFQSLHTTRLSADESITYDGEMSLTAESHGKLHSGAQHGLSVSSSTGTIAVGSETGGLIMQAADSIVLAADSSSAVESLRSNVSLVATTTVEVRGQQGIDLTSQSGDIGMMTGEQDLVFVSNNSMDLNAHDSIDLASARTASITAESAILLNAADLNVHGDKATNIYSAAGHVVVRSSPSAGNATVNIVGSTGVEIMAPAGQATLVGHTDVTMNGSSIRLAANEMDFIASVGSVQLASANSVVNLAAQDNVHVASSQDSVVVDAVNISTTSTNYRMQAALGLTTVVEGPIAIGAAGILDLNAVSGISVDSVGAATVRGTDGVAVYSSAYVDISGVWNASIGSGASNTAMQATVDAVAVRGTGPVTVRSADVSLASANAVTTSSSSSRIASEHADLVIESTGRDARLRGDSTVLRTLAGPISIEGNESANLRSESGRIVITSNMVNPEWVQGIYGDSSDVRATAEGSVSISSAAGYVDLVSAESVRFASANAHVSADEQMHVVSNMLTVTAANNSDFEFGSANLTSENTVIQSATDLFVSASERVEMDAASVTAQTASNFDAYGQTLFANSNTVEMGGSHIAVSSAQNVTVSSDRQFVEMHGAAGVSIRSQDVIIKSTSNIESSASTFSASGSSFSAESDTAIQLNSGKSMSMQADNIQWFADVDSAKIWSTGPMQFWADTTRVEAPQVQMQATGSDLQLISSTSGAAITTNMSQVHIAGATAAVRSTGNISVQSHADTTDSASVNISGSAGVLIDSKSGDTALAATRSLTVSSASMVVNADGLVDLSSSNGSIQLKSINGSAALVSASTASVTSAQSLSLTAAMTANLVSTSGSIALDAQDMSMQSSDISLTSASVLSTSSAAVSIRTTYGPYGSNQTDESMTVDSESGSWHSLGPDNWMGISLAAAQRLTLDSDMVEADGAVGVDMSALSLAFIAESGVTTAAERLAVFTANTRMQIACAQNISVVSQMATTVVNGTRAVQLESDHDLMVASQLDTHVNAGLGIFGGGLMGTTLASSAGGLMITTNTHAVRARAKDIGISSIAGDVVLNGTESIRLAGEQVAIRGNRTTLNSSSDANFTAPGLTVRAGSCFSSLNVQGPEGVNLMSHAGIGINGEFTSVTGATGVNIKSTIHDISIAGGGALRLKSEMGQTDIYGHTGIQVEAAQDVVVNAASSLSSFSAGKTSISGNTVAVSSPVNTIDIHSSGQLSAHGAGRLSLSTQTNDMMLVADAGVSISADEISISSGSLSFTSIAGEMQMESSAGTLDLHGSDAVDIESNSDVLLTAGQNVDLTSSAGAVDIAATYVLAETEHGDASFISYDEIVDIQAVGVFMEALNSDVSIEAEHSVQIESNGMVRISGADVAVQSSMSDVFIAADTFAELGGSAGVSLQSDREVTLNGEERVQTMSSMLNVMSTEAQVVSSDALIAVKASGDSLMQATLDASVAADQIAVISHDNDTALRSAQGLAAVYAQADLSIASLHGNITVATGITNLGSAGNLHIESDVLSVEAEEAINLHADDSMQLAGSHGSILAENVAMVASSGDADIGSSSQLNLQASERLIITGKSFAASSGGQSNVDVEAEKLIDIVADSILQVEAQDSVEFQSAADIVYRTPGVLNLEGSSETLVSKGAIDIASDTNQAWMSRQSLNITAAQVALRSFEAINLSSHADGDISIFASDQAELTGASDVRFVAQDGIAVMSSQLTFRTTAKQHAAFSSADDFVNMTAVDRLLLSSGASGTYLSAVSNIGIDSSSAPIFVESGDVISAMSDSNVVVSTAHNATIASSGGISFLASDIYASAGSISATTASAVLHAADTMSLRSADVRIDDSNPSAISTVSGREVSVFAADDVNVRANQIFMSSCKKEDSNLTQFGA
eukprot:SAG31_NODE_36_length_31714_cov_61.379598_3_plen_3590_part_01